MQSLMRQRAHKETCGCCNAIGRAATWCKGMVRARPTFESLMGERTFENAHACPASTSLAPDDSTPAPAPPMRSRLLGQCSAVQGRDVSPSPPETRQRRAPPSSVPSASQHPASSLHIQRTPPENRETQPLRPPLSWAARITLACVCVNAAETLYTQVLAR